MKKDAEVWLIGAGPGDEGLITVKGREYLGKADAVVYDRLVPLGLLKYAKPDAELIYVGKESSGQSGRQNKINEKLISLAKQGKNVARLKGGDPFVFGRGGEEAEELRKAGIEFRIVPGVSSCIAAPAYAGIPVTHRDFASSFHVIAAHETDGKENIDYGLLSKLSGTLVFLMGVGKLNEICGELIENGKSPDTPAVIIENGTTKKQRSVIGTLGDICEKAKQADIKPPSVTVIGGCAALAGKLTWVDRGILWGKCGVVTRAAKQADEFSEKLEAFGCDVAEYPSIEIVKKNSRKFDEFIGCVYDNDWICFTSPNGVGIFMEMLAEKKIDIRCLSRCKFAAIGKATAKSLSRFGIIADLVPPEFTSEALGGILAEKAEGAIWIMRSKNGSKALTDILKKSGKVFYDIAIYETLPAGTAAELKTDSIDFTTFMSSSSVKGFLDMTGGGNEDILKKPVFCIGPKTAETAEKKGFENIIAADEYTSDGLLKAIVDYYKKGSENNDV